VHSRRQRLKHQIGGHVIGAPDAQPVQLRRCDGSDRRGRHGGTAFGEEGIAQARSLRRGRQVGEGHLFRGQPLGKGQQRRRLDTVEDTGLRQRDRPAPRGSDGVLIGRHILEAAPHVAGASGHQPLGRHGKGCAGQVLFHHAVDQTQRQSLGRADRGTGQHQAQGIRGTDQTRQPLGAAGAGQQAQIDLGQAQQGAGIGNAVMRRQRQFQTAAKGSAVQGRDHGFRAGFDQPGELAEAHRKIGFAKLGNIGTGGKAPALPAQHDGADAGVLHGNGQRLHQGQTQPG